MNLCNGKRGRGVEHDEICFEGHECPFCAYISESGNTLLELTQEVNSLSSEVEALQAEVERLSEPLIATMQAVREEIEREKGQAP